VVVASRRDLREATKIVDDVIKKNLETISGVGQVRFIGEATRQNPDLAGWEQAKLL